MTNRTSLAPRMAAIKETYPDLEGFFTELLKIPTTEESLAALHRIFARLRLGGAPANRGQSAVSNRDHATENLFNHLNETEEEDRAEALASLKDSIGIAYDLSSAVTMVGLTRRIPLVLYPDTPSLRGIAHRQT